MTVEYELKQTVELYQQGRFDEMLEVVRPLHGRLLQAGGGSSENLGWARFYLYKALYGSARYVDAWAIYNLQQQQPACVDPKNLAQMHSIGAELAVRTGQTVEAVARAAEACLDLRRSLRDFDSIVMCCLTACNLLRLCDLEDRNEIFSRQLVNCGAANQLTEAYLDGWSRLIDNAMRSGRWTRIPPLREEFLRRGVALPWTPEAEARRDQLVGRLDSPTIPPSNREELRAFLAGGPVLPGDPTGPDERARFDAAAALARAGRFEEALVAYRAWKPATGKPRVSGEYFAKILIRQAATLMDLGRYQEAVDLFAGEAMETMQGQLATHDLFELAFAQGNALGALGDITRMDRCMSYALDLAGQKLGDADRSARAWYWLLHWGVQHSAWDYLEENAPLAHTFGMRNQMYRVQHWAAEAWVKLQAARGDRALARRGAAEILWRLRVAGAPPARIEEWTALAEG